MYTLLFYGVNFPILNLWGTYTLDGIGNFSGDPKPLDLHKFMGLSWPSEQ